MINLTIVIPKLLITLDLWFGILDLNKAKHVKKKQANNYCSMAPNEIVGLVHVKMTKKHIEPFLIDESSISVELSHFSSFLGLNSTIKLGLWE